MKIIVRLYGVLRSLAGDRERIEIELDERDDLRLIRLIERLLEEYPELRRYISVEDDKLRVRGVSIILNGQHIMFLEGENTLLKNEDIIDLIPPVSGGI
ncbi:MAG: MoaD/ThiS family protein [Sulfolobales archaeon]